MDSPWYKTWSDSPAAPQITKYLYTVEKATLAGSFIGTTLYGLLTLLFFQCMVALLNPPYRRDEGIKLWLVFYTMAMFSFVTVYTAMNLYIQSNAFIDNRISLRGSDTSGPFNYQYFIRATALGLIPSVMFNLNNWLADGLLIYRCYIIYSTNPWAIAIPCLMYLASLGMGIVTLYLQYTGEETYTPLRIPQLGVPYISISVSLNVLLTLMIVIRLVLYGRNIRAASGSLTGISGLYHRASTMLIESCAIFAVNSLLVVGALAAVVYNSAADPSVRMIGGFIVDIFYPILAEIQVIAPLLIIQRVANGSALTGRTITTGHTSLFKARNRGELTDSECVPLGGYPASSAAGYGKHPYELGVAVKTMADFHLDGEA